MLPNKQVEETSASGHTRTEAARLIFERYPKARKVLVYELQQVEPYEFTRKEVA